MDKITAPLISRQHFKSCKNALLVLAFCSAAAVAAPRHLAVPGGIALVKVPESTLSAHYLDDRVMLTKINDEYLAIVGIPLTAQPGQQELKIRLANEEERGVQFNVEQKEYPTQSITIKDTGKVDLSPKNEERVAKEHAEIKAFKRTFNVIATPDIDFAAPADGPLSSTFGSRRIFNGKPRAPHVGLDFAVPAGAPIKSAAAGTVLAATDYFFNGRTVFVDHGQGLISMYCHLEQIDVRPGQTLSRGDSIGTAGSTGRASGPHLHWSVILNSTMVDPALFLPTETDAPKESSPASP